METLILKLSSGLEYIADICADVLINSGIVIFPTETVYGIGAHAFRKDAVEKIFKIKGRKRDNPLIFHVSNYDMIYSLADVSGRVKKIIEEFMPGPLTVVLKSRISKEFTFGLETIALRMPDNLVALKIIEKLSFPVVAPSANISGRPSGTDFSHVFEDFNGKVDVIINGGKTVFGIESTVIDMTTEPFSLLRPGAVSKEELEEKGVNVVFPETEDLLKRSPGTRYRHYAPNALVVPVNTESELHEKMKDYRGKKVAFIGLNPVKSIFFKEVIFHNVAEYGRLLYATLRYLDAVSVDVIFAFLPEKTGIGLAICDRLKRASER